MWTVTFQSAFENRLGEDMMWLSHRMKFDLSAQVEDSKLHFRAQDTTRAVFHHVFAVEICLQSLINASVCMLPLLMGVSLLERCKADACLHAVGTTRSREQATAAAGVNMLQMRTRHVCCSHFSLLISGLVIPSHL